MGLQGTLEDFGIADIFQLIGQQKKTGILVAARNDNSVHIHFRDGCILGAEAQNRNMAERLGEMMVLAGLITKEQLHKALEIQRKTLQKLGTILLENNSIKKSELDEFIYLQTKETIYKLFRWSNGTYEFLPQEIAASAEFFQPISAEHILMDGFRIIDEWPAIRKKIGSFSAVYERVPGKEVAVRGGGKIDLDQDLDAAFSAFEGESMGQSEESMLPPNAERIYELVDGRRDVSSLIAFSRLGEFDACLSLTQLIDSGHVQLSHKIAEAPGVADGVDQLSIDLYQDYESPQRQLLTFLPRIAYYVAFVVLWVVLLSYIGIGPFGERVGAARQKIMDVVVKDLMSDYQMQRLDTVLEIYYLKNSYYPRNLQELVTGGLVGAGDLHLPWQEEYVYRSDGASYKLEKPFR